MSFQDGRSHEILDLNFYTQVLRSMELNDYKLSSE